MHRRIVSLWVAALGLGSACGPVLRPVVDDESDGDSEDPSEAEATTSEQPPSMTSTSTTSPPTTADGTGDPTTDPTVDPTTDPTGADVAYCAPTCETVADCVVSGTDPSDFACVDGFCEWVGELTPCDESTCPSDAGLACVDIDGVSQCTFVCTEGGGECEGFGFLCTGLSESGVRFCEPGPCGGIADEGEPCVYEGFGQLGVCTDGVCTCTDDSQCTAAGFACAD